MGLKDIADSEFKIQSLSEKTKNLLKKELEEALEEDEIKLSENTK